MQAVTKDVPKDATLNEALQELLAEGDPRELDRADEEVKRVVEEANRADIRGIRLIEQGRCPACQGRTEHFVYTTVCPACGWFRRSVPETGRSVLHLEDGSTLECDRVFPTRSDEYLCVRDGIVVAQVMRGAVRRVEHHWRPDEIERLREEARRRRSGVCSWCESELKEPAEGEDGAEDGQAARLEDYVAFGAYQEHHIFCCEECMRRFRKQYPSRIHRNCYETDCRDCDECVKRYDVSGFRRNRLGSV